MCVCVCQVRYAGKTIPPEKYAITMANRFIAGEKELVLPALELFYVWNIFSYASNAPSLLEHFLTLINKKLRIEEQKVDDMSQPLDSYCYLQLMRGVCLRNLGRPLEACECFENVLKNEDRCLQDTYLPPVSLMNICLLHE